MCNDMTAIQRTDKILIVGGTGYIGRHLVRRCLQHSPHIVCVGRERPLSPTNGMADVRIVHTDMRKPKQLKTDLADDGFDYVFNLGGYIDHRSFLDGGRQVVDAHFNGVMNLIACLNRERLKGFVQIGSSDEYGNCPAPQQEAMREQPISAYSLAKTAATHLIQTLAGTENFPGVVLRLFLVYGPGQDEGRFLPQIIKGCLDDLAFKTSEGKQLRDFCFVEDVVDAMVRAAVRPTARGHVINIGSGEPITIREMVQKIVGMTGGGKPLWGTFPYRTGENMALYPDTHMAYRLLDWKPRTGLEEGLAKTIEHYRPGKDR